MNRERISTKTLFFLGRPFAPLYSALMSLRVLLYNSGFFKRHRLSVPVVSVGNLHLGGTGKTPLIKYIAKFLQRNGRNPTILSRGYRGKAHGQVNVVSNGRKIFMAAAACGDEPRLLAESLPGVPVITGKKRAVTGRYAIEQLSADTILLDDAFQHLSIERDLDLVLFNASKPLVEDRILPAGELREPITALKRAHGFIITGADGSNRHNTETIMRFLREHYPGKPTFLGKYKTVEPLYDSRGGTHSLEEARRLAFYGFCGIANPLCFRQTLTDEHFNILEFSTFRDHHIYSQKDIDMLRKKARSLKAQALITTEKDFVKLGPFFKNAPPLLLLKIELAMEEAFEYFLAERLLKKLMTGGDL